MDRASLEKLLRQGLSLAETGRRFDLHESTLGYWAHKHGLEAVNRARHAAKGGLTLEELEPLVAAGMSIAQIAKAVGRGKATARGQPIQNRKTGGALPPGWRPGDPIRSRHRRFPEKHSP